MCILITTCGNIVVDLLWHDAYPAGLDHAVYYKGHSEHEVVARWRWPSMLDAIQRAHPTSAIAGLQASSDRNVVATRVLNAYGDNADAAWTGHVLVGSLTSNHDIARSTAFAAFCQIS